jgi:hypothetical protein
MEVVFSPEKGKGFGFRQARPFNFFEDMGLIFSFF